MLQSHSWSRFGPEMFSCQWPGFDIFHEVLACLEENLLPGDMELRSSFIFETANSGSFIFSLNSAGKWNNFFFLFSSSFSIHTLKETSCHFAQSAGNFLGQIRQFIRYVFGFPHDHR